MARTSSRRRPCCVVGGHPPARFERGLGGGSARGPRWRQLLDAGLSAVAGFTRDLTLRTVGASRSLLPGIDLAFNNPAPRYDFARDIVAFRGSAFGLSVDCAISREALDDHFGTDGLDKDGRIEAFLKNRSKIEKMARVKYLNWAHRGAECRVDKDLGCRGPEGVAQRGLRPLHPMRERCSDASPGSFNRAGVKASLTCATPRRGYSRRCRQSHPLFGRSG